ncbi:MAG: carboxypeptidase M32 [Nitrospirota bacterium]|nr:carboxypeptidase M32 [Nitrospirota bacterium]
MTAPLTALKAALSEIHALEGASHLLVWDQHTHMPPGGEGARGGHLAALKNVIHQRATSPELGRLLEAAERHLPELDPDGDDSCLIRVARRDFERQTRIPSDYVGRFAEHSADGFAAWSRAREANDFQLVRPFLERTVDLSREYSGFFPAAHVADPLIDHSDPGWTVATITPLFSALREGLVPLVAAIGERPQPECGFLFGDFPERQQMALSLKLAERIGYDTARGRLDLSLHPFSISFAVDDVRITTRVKTDDLTECLFSTLHEAGHGMYEQGIGAALDGTPLASGASSGVHESQSRLWENLVGRSRPFWDFAWDELTTAFPAQLSGVGADEFHRAINRVQPSLIRTDADEVTYNLHVMMRFDLEIALLDGSLKVSDLPRAWAERIQSDLGVSPTGDADGALQDVHWFCDHVGGAFQGYTLGNLMSAQFFAAAQAAHPNLAERIAEGDFAPLLGWLREHLHRHGRKFDDHRLIRDATGGDLAVTPFLDYLRAKYTPLYGLSGA